MNEPILDSLETHVAALKRCRRCPNMVPPPVSGGAVMSKVVLVGQAPGVKEPQVGRPFAWTAGRTLFKWFEDSCGMDEATFRSRIYMAAVCRCFPGKTGTGGDRVPSRVESENCAAWLEREFALLEPRLVIAVGKLAIGQFMHAGKLDTLVGKSFQVSWAGHAFDLVPLPHPSGASPWPRVEPGKTLLQQGLSLIRVHPAMQAILDK